MVGSLPQMLENQFFLAEPVPIGEGILDEWEDIERTGRGFFEFAAKYALMQPCDMAPETAADHVVNSSLLGRVVPLEAHLLSDDDYCGVRDVLDLAGKLRAYVVRGDVTLDELRGCGIEPRFWDDMVPTYTEVQGFSNLSYHSAVIKVPLKGRSYIEWLKSRIDGGMTVEPDESDGFFLTVGISRGWQGADGDAEGCFDVLPGLALQQIAGLHLSEIQTAVDRYGVPHQLARWGICALWLAYCNRFSRARIAFCEACGRPIVVTEERGTPRQYCDERCRQWRKRNKDVDSYRGLRTTLKDDKKRSRRKAAHHG